jgi:hypothetical protein
MTSIVCPTANTILRHIERMGYIVKAFHRDGTIELHAVPRDGGEPQIARCNDGDGENEELRAAALLAEACGVDVEDG